VIRSVILFTVRTLGCTYSLGQMVAEQRLVERWLEFRSGTAHMSSLITALVEVMRRSCEL